MTILNLNPRMDLINALWVGNTFLLFCRNNHAGFVIGCRNFQYVNDIHFSYAYCLNFYFLERPIFQTVHGFYYFSEKLLNESNASEQLEKFDRKNYNELTRFRPTIHRSCNVLAFKLENLKKMAHIFLPSDIINKAEKMNEKTFMILKDGSLNPYCLQVDNPIKIIRVSNDALVVAVITKNKLYFFDIND